MIWKLYTAIAICIFDFLQFKLNETRQTRGKLILSFSVNQYNKSMISYVEQIVLKELLLLALISFAIDVNIIIIIIMKAEQIKSITLFTFWKKEKKENIYEDQ